MWRVPERPVAEPVQLQTAAPVGIYCLEQSLIAAPRRGRGDGPIKFGAGLERIEQRRGIRPRGEIVASHPARSGNGEPGMNGDSRRC